MNETIRFDDGAAYERYMGKWSQLVGKCFLDWLSPAPGQRWLDVGCGNGAFTELFVERCAPAIVKGIDPSQEQLTYARNRPRLSATQFLQGDAMALPFPDKTFDIAVMPLVIFFVPDPAKGVAEMARVVASGGTVTAYAWDMVGKGFPYELLRSQLQELGFEVPTPPAPDSSRLDSMRELWSAAGINSVKTHAITVQRVFADFDDYWETVLGGPGMRKRLATMTPQDLALLKSRMQVQLAPGVSGSITCSAWANAIKGRVPV